MSHRKLQIESTLKRTISGVIARQLADPRVTGLVSVTRVEVSSDLRTAGVYVSVMPPKYERRTLAGLEHAAGRIASLVGRQVRIRSVPRLIFRLDESLKKQAAVFDAIQRSAARLSSSAVDSST